MASTGRLIRQPRPSVQGSGMDGFLLYMGAEFFPQRLVRNQVNATAEEVFQIEQQAEETFGRGWSVKPDQNVNVTRVRGFVAGGRPENGNIRDGELLCQSGFMLPQERQCLIPSHQNAVAEACRIILPCVLQCGLAFPII